MCTCKDPLNDRGTLIAELSYLEFRNELLDAVGERVAAEDEDAAPECDRAPVVPR